MLFGVVTREGEAVAGHVLLGDVAGEVVNHVLGGGARVGFVVEVEAGGGVVGGVALEVVDAVLVEIGPGEEGSDGGAEGVDAVVVLFFAADEDEGIEVVFLAEILKEVREVGGGCKEQVVFDILAAFAPAVKGENIFFMARFIF